MQPVDPNSPRGKLHHAIRRCFTKTITAHYRNHPDWFDDERGKKGVSALLGLMHDILNTIDDYEICDHKERRKTSGD